MSESIKKFVILLLMNQGAPRCALEPNLNEPEPGVQVRVQQLVAPNLHVQVQVHKKHPEPEPNWTATSLLWNVHFKLLYCFII